MIKGENTIKVKAKRTIFTVSFDGTTKRFVYDSRRKPKNSELLFHAKHITGCRNVKIVSRETFELVLTMSFETFYEFADVEYTDN